MLHYGYPWLLYMHSSPRQDIWNVNWLSDISGEKGEGPMGISLQLPHLLNPAQQLRAEEGPGRGPSDL